MSVFDFSTQGMLSFNCGEEHFCPCNPSAVLDFTVCLDMTRVPRRKNAEHEKRSTVRHMGKWHASYVKQIGNWQELCDRIPLYDRRSAELLKKWHAVPRNRRAKETQFRETRGWMTRNFKKQMWKWHAAPRNRCKNDTQLQETHVKMTSSSKKHMWKWHVAPRNRCENDMQLQEIDMKMTRSSKKQMRKWHTAPRNTWANATHSATIHLGVYYIRIPLTLLLWKPRQGVGGLGDWFPTVSRSKAFLMEFGLLFCVWFATRSFLREISFPRTSPVDISEILWYVFGRFGCVLCIRIYIPTYIIASSRWCLKVADDVIDGILAMFATCQSCLFLFDKLVVVLVVAAISNLSRVSFQLCSVGY